jgi:hypothetical protein
MNGTVYHIPTRYPHIKFENVSNLVLKNNCYIRPITMLDSDHIMEHELKISERYWQIPNGSHIRVNAYKFAYCVIFPQPVHGYAGFMCSINALLENKNP